MNIQLYMNYMELLNWTLIWDSVDSYTVVRNSKDISHTLYLVFPNDNVLKTIV